MKQVLQILNSMLKEKELTNNLLKAGKDSVFFQTDYPEIHKNLDEGIKNNEILIEQLKDAIDVLESV